MSSRYRHRKDGNSEEVVTALRAYGWSVYDNSQSQEDGVADLFVSRAGRTVACEVKLPGKPLRASQQKWMQSWQGETAILTSFEDVARLTADPPSRQLS